VTLVSEELNDAIDPISTSESIVSSESISETSIVPPESGAEEAFAAAANAIPAVGSPIVVDPYAVFNSTGDTPHNTRTAPHTVGAAPHTVGAAPHTHTYVAPSHQAHGTPVVEVYPNTHYAGAPTPSYGPTVTTTTYSPTYGYQNRTAGAYDGFAIAALGCGIAGMIGVAPIIGAVLGVIFGIVALQRIKETGARGHGLAVAGIVTGAVGLLFGLFLLVWIVPMLISNTLGYW